MNTRAFPLTGLCHGCLVHQVNIANNAYYFVKNLTLASNDEPNEV